MVSKKECSFQTVAVYTAVQLKYCAVLHARLAPVSYLQWVWAGSEQLPWFSSPGSPSWPVRPGWCRCTTPVLTGSVCTGWTSRSRSSSQTHTLWTYTPAWSVPEIHTHTKKRETAPTSGQSSLRTVSLFRSARLFFFFICSIIYIFTPQFCRVQLGMGGNGRNISSWQGVFAVASRNSLETHTCVCTKTHTYTEGHPFTMYRTEWFQSLDAITQLVQFTCNKQQSTASFTPSTV